MLITVFMFKFAALTQRPLKETKIEGAFPKL